MDLSAKSRSCGVEDEHLAEKVGRGDAGKKRVKGIRDGDERRGEKKQEGWLRVRKGGWKRRGKGCGECCGRRGCRSRRGVKWTSKPVWSVVYVEALCAFLTYFSSHPFFQLSFSSLLTILSCLFCFVSSFLRIVFRCLISFVLFVYFLCFSFPLELRSFLLHFPIKYRWLRNNFIFE